MKNKFILFSLILFSIAISVFRSVLFWDTAVYLENGRYFLTGGSNYFELQRPPLFQIFAGIMYNNILMFRLFVSVLFITFILTSYLIFKKFSNGKVALISSVLLATNPIVSFWGSELLPHLLSGLFISLSIFFFMKERYLYAGALTGFIFLSRYVDFSIFFLMAAYLLYQRKFREIALMSLSSFAVVSPWLLYSYLNYGSPLASLSEALQLSAWSPQVGTLFYFKSVISFMGFSPLLMFFSLFEFRKNKFVKFNWLWIAVALLTLSYFNYKDLRYTFIVMMSVAFLAGFGFNRKYSKDPKFATVLLFLIITVNFTIFNSWYDDYSECPQDAIIKLSQRAASLEGNIASNQWSLVAYFSNTDTIPLIVWREYTPQYLSENNVSVFVIQNSTDADAELISAIKNNGYTVEENINNCLDVYLLKTS